VAGEQLRVTEGKARGTRLAVDGEFLLGRAAPEGDGRLGDDPEISRRHARLSRGSRGELRIEDLGSSNGTFVNGERLEAARVLELGDVVRVGTTELAVTDAEGQVPEETRIGSPAVTKVTVPEELLVLEGRAKGKRMTLGDEFLIGRAESGDGRLGDDPELSRRHARIFRDGGRIMIEDLGSANGTFVNGERLRGEPRALQPGDALRVGQTTLEIAGPASPVAAVAAAPPAPVAPPAPAAPPAPVAPPPRAERPAPSPVPLPSSPPRPAAPPADALPIGSVFAGCRVEEIIGFGDMGVVYRAEELSLQRRVALKVIRPEHSEEARFRERFRRESRAAASIDHPNVIPILEADEEDGTLFITMRLVEGTDLGGLLAAEGPLEPQRAARVVRQVGAALDAAHARGLVHRDIKPANVLLARGDHVYLTDFGLARRQEEPGGLTRKGSIVARAEYVAPEQILEDRVDALSDVYALGCLLYEALTGAAPFADSPDGPAVLAHVSSPAPSPSERRPELPAAFDDVVRRAMAKAPGERFPSAGDLGQAALVAAGDQRRASPESVVATGPAAPPPAAMPGLSRAFTPVPDDGEAAAAAGGRGDALRWGIALAFLAIMAIAMVAALNALNTL
jgi:pSer/pThr/pTyr-binding forkhead associated (FHA) protein/tRNA A-37 threonylcarbamoyl transferase component Bud32